jgi:phosphoribosylformylglycinamidine cyclo-ligase
MVAVVAPEKAEAVAEVLAGEGERVVTLGRIAAGGEGARVAYKGALRL